MKRARWQKQIEVLIGPVFEFDARYGGSLMERFNDVGSEENILNFNVADDALERVAVLADGPAWTLNFCTYNYYQCGPIGIHA